MLSSEQFDELLQRSRSCELLYIGKGKWDSIMNKRIIALLIGIAAYMLIPEGYSFNNHLPSAAEQRMERRIQMIQDGPRKCMDEDAGFFEIRYFSEENWCSEYRRMKRNINAPIPSQGD